MEAQVNKHLSACGGPSLFFVPGHFIELLHFYLRAIKTNLVQEFSEKSMISISLKQILRISYSTFHFAECWAI